MIKVECNCPFCDRSLMDPEYLINNEPSVTLFGKIRDTEIDGFVHLSPFYGDYNVESTMAIPIDAIVDFSCPYCKENLISSRGCEICSANMVALKMDRGGKVQFCARRGCQKHLLEFDDPESDLMAFYKEYSPTLDSER